MSPRPGGEADKFGARYEGAWTVSHLLNVLAGTGKSISVEVPGELDDGAEFLFTRATDGVVEAHQVKRQAGNANNWTVSALNGLNIWENAKVHIDAGREFHFVSMVPSAALRELTDRARRSASLAEFVKNWLTGGLKSTFDDLGKADIYGSPAEAWRLLRGMWFQTHDERAIVSNNSALSGALLDGAAGALAALGLGDIVIQNLGVPLTETLIEGQLSSYGLQRASTQRVSSLGASIADVTSKWRDSVDRERLKPSIPRAEAQALATNAVNASGAQVTFLVGSAGGGKSAVLAQAVDELYVTNAHVLAFRLDRQGDFATGEELGQKLGFDVSPASALGAAAAGAPCVLLIDQLDAVSLVSGRMPTSFNAVEDLIREASAFPNMHVVLVCRQFDVDNDFRIRTLRDQLKAETVEVLSLPDDAVDAAVDAMGLRHESLTSRQRKLLRLPLHLVLLAGVADQPDALNFETTAHLFDAYWQRKRLDIEQRKPDVKFMEVITTVTTAISDRQQLSVSDTVLDQGDLARDGDAFISEHVLVRDGNRIAFFHEAFFDYAFARQWATKSQTLLGFLTASEQELFRRAQVRQVLHHLRERDTTRYLAELRPVLESPDVRFHIKEAVLAVLASVADPTTAELRVLLGAMATDPDVAARIWQTLRSPSWFQRLDDDGQLRRWLDSGPSTEHQHAIDILGSGARADPDRVAAILRNYKSKAEYHDWLLWASRFADVDASRALFDLVLDAVRAGAVAGREHAFWLSMHTLADDQPAWAIELLQAFFVQWPGGLNLTGDRKVIRLTLREHTLSELLKKAAQAEPHAFIDGMLPYMTDAMKAAAHPDHKPPGFPTDSHFSYYYEEMIDNSDADDALYLAMRTAIKHIVSADPDAARPILEGLAAIRLSSAQSLLYLGLIAGGASYADWSVELLLESVDRLLCGTMSNSVWVTRQLIQTIAPHISDAQHQALENAVRDLTFQWESRGGTNYYAFNLLSALQEERLSELGRRRLGEYQRRFNEDAPREPEGVTSGWIGSPIDNDAVVHMTDENWLQAIAKHDVDTTNWSTFTGGARELAHLLQQQTKEDPLRFARLAQQLDADVNAAYGDAILLGLAEAAAVATGEEETIFDAIRHLAGLGQASNDRWLGHALRPYLKSAPLDLVEAVRDRAVSAIDPVSERDLDVSNERQPGERLASAGLNSARGAAAEDLGNLLVFDVDGSRTAAVVPIMDQLATDNVVAVRAQAAHALAAALRFARPEAVAAFVKLVGTDDIVLTGRFVRKLMLYIGNGGDHDVVVPVVQRMIDSADADVRQCGGELALVAALDWSRRDQLDAVMAGQDAAARKGVAVAAAARASSNGNTELATETLKVLFGDLDPGVREAAAGLAANLRDEQLAPYEDLLLALIDSPAYEASVPQLFITLQHAPDEVGSLALRSSQRFVEVFEASVGDISTGAAGDTHYICDLVVRGLAQSQDPVERAALLDVIDELLKLGAYGVDEAIDNAGR